MKKLLLSLTLSLLLPALSFAGQGGQERLIRRAPVPSHPPYQGEIRLLQRDSGAVVQILLNSKVMNRVVAVIQENESKDWPQSREGSADSRRYTEELLQAYKTVKARAKERQKGADRHLQLMIEFVVDDQRSEVALYLPTFAERDGRVTVQDKELLKKLPLSRNYVRRDIKLILEDAFGVDGEEAVELLQQAEGGA